jgi:hypothetical protein
MTLHISSTSVGEGPRCRGENWSVGVKSSDGALGGNPLAADLVCTPKCCGAANAVGNDPPLLLVVVARAGVTTGASRNAGATRFKIAPRFIVCWSLARVYTGKRVIKMA